MRLAGCVWAVTAHSLPDGKFTREGGFARKLRKRVPE